jgi:hypothetical protein
VGDSKLFLLIAIHQKCTASPLETRGDLRVKRLGLILLNFFIATTAHAAVWESKNNWSPEWEKKFQEWIQTSWQVDFFSRKTLPNGQSNPYYGIQTDCADTVYTSRVIFAYENSLPFVVRDPSASGRTLSNKMARFDSQPNLKRVKSFLNYIYDIVSTSSLPGDTYPVAITRETVSRPLLLPPPR